MSRKLLAYIPARGGSKRVVKKNIRELDGVPVLARVIRSVRKLDGVSKVCVSTDDPEIAKIADSEGALTLALRAENLSDDHTSVVDLFKLDVPRYLAACGFDPVTTDVLLVLPTAAMLTIKTLQSAYQKFSTSSAPLLVSLKALEFSPARSLERDAAGLYHPLVPNRLMQRSQDLPAAAIDAGQFYFLRYAVMSSHAGHWFSVPGGVAGVELAEHEAIDVDTEADWLTLERVFRAVSLESQS